MKDRYDKNRESAIEIGKEFKYELLRYYPVWIFKFGKTIIDVNDDLMGKLAELLHIEWTYDNE